MHTTFPSGYKFNVYVDSHKPFSIVYAVERKSVDYKKEEATLQNTTSLTRKEGESTKLITTASDEYRGDT
jgi:hypothetical protein